MTVALAPNGGIFVCARGVTADGGVTRIWDIRKATQWIRSKLRMSLVTRVIACEGITESFRVRGKPSIRDQKCNTSCTVHQYI